MGICTPFYKGPLFQRICRYVLHIHINNTKLGLPQDRECLGLNYEYVPMPCPSICSKYPGQFVPKSTIMLKFSFNLYGDYSDLVPNLSQGGALVQKKYPQVVFSSKFYYFSTIYCQLYKLHEKVDDHQ